MSWTPERIETAKDLWAEGQSATLIASQIEGKSRNAVIGKLYRLGLLGQANAVAARRRSTERRKKPQRSRGRLIKPAQYNPHPLPPETPAPALLVPTLDLQPHHCRWPVGDPKQPSFGHCGAKKLPGSSYCAHHAWVSTNKRSHPQPIVAK